MTTIEENSRHSAVQPAARVAKSRSPSVNAASPRDPQSRLISRLLELAGPNTRIVSAHSRPWASATFIGAQHAVVLEMRESSDGVRADAFADALAEADLPVPGHIVADVTIDVRDSEWHGEECRTLFHLTALTIEDW